jgi:hypothetical protein
LVQILRGLLGAQGDYCEFSEALPWRIHKIWCLSHKVLETSRMTRNFCGVQPVHKTLSGNPPLFIQHPSISGSTPALLCPLFTKNESSHDLRLEFNFKNCVALRVSIQVFPKRLFSKEKRTRNG